MSDEGRLPATWMRARLDEVCTINGRSFSILERSLNLPAAFVPMAAVVEEFGGIDVSAARPLSDVVKGYTSFVEGDVLFAKITPCMENGKVALVPPLAHHVGFGSTEFHVVRSAGAVEPKWVAYYLSQLEFRRAARQDMTGSAGQLRVQSGWLAGSTLPIAPLAEQQRILLRVEEVLSELDAGVAELLTAQKKLTQYRQSLLKAAIEGDLTAEWRAKNPPQETGAELLARILRGQPSAPQASTADDGALPSTWAWANAAQLCGFITKGTTPPKGTGEGEAKTVPFLRVTNLTQTGALDFTDQVFVSHTTHREFLARSRVLPGDVLMNIVGPPLGQVSLVPESFPEWNVNQAIAIFRPVGGVSNRYLRVALLSPVVQRWLAVRAKTTAGQTNLTLELCRALPIPLPPLAEQGEISRLVEDGLEALDALDAEIRRMLRMAAAQRQNFLRAAFSGQLVPQDPNDEPASVLLARIRAERKQFADRPSRRAPRRTKAAAA